MMNKAKLNRVWGMLLLAGCISLSMASLAWSDSDEYEYGSKYSAERGEAGEAGMREAGKRHGLEPGEATEKRERGERGWSRSTSVNMAVNKQYQDECSACHFAYPASFLPERSWVKLMGDLDDHFGENAKLDAKTNAAITAYLMANAADRAPTRFSRSFMRSISPHDTPLRISDTAYFRHKHSELPDRMVKNNPKVRSLSNCETCHSGAAKGSFDEDSVFIPGFGSWED